MAILRIILPVFLICVLAVYAVFSAKKKTGYKSNEDKQKSENNISEGMAIGMCLGTAVGIALGKENLAVGMSMGMLLGMVIGMNSKK